MHMGDYAMGSATMRAAWLDYLTDEMVVRMIEGVAVLRAAHPDGFSAVAVRSGKQWEVILYDGTRCLDLEVCDDSATLVVCLRESFPTSCWEALCGDGRWRPLGDLFGAMC